MQSGVTPTDVETKVLNNPTVSLDEVTQLQDLEKAEEERQWKATLEESERALIENKQEDIEGTEQKAVTELKPEDDKVDTPGEVVGEIGAIFGGGATKAAESLVTLPEKAVDILTGEWAEEQKAGGYEAEWNPFGGHEHAMTRTAWGGMLQSIVHTAGVAVGLVYGGGLLLKKAGTAIPGAVLKRTGATWLGKNVFMSQKLLPGFKWTTGLPTATLPVVGKVGFAPTVGNLATGAAIGAGVDVANEELHQGDTISKQVLERHPWLSPVLGPLATKDRDHPLMHLFKHVMEGMTIGAIFDSVLLGNDGLSGLAAVKKRVKDTDAQQLRRAKTQVAEGSEYGGYKAAEGMADPGQGVTTSTGPIRQSIKNQDQIDLGTGLGQGSVSGVLDADDVGRLAKASGIEEEVFQKHFDDLISGSKYAAERELWKAQGLTPQQIRQTSLRRMQEMLQSRDWTEMNVEDFWEPMFRNQGIPDPWNTPIDPNVIVWTPDHVATADAINNALFKKLRDQAIAARELFNITDILDKDGPMHGIAEKLVVGLTNTKRYRYIVGRQMENLGAALSKSEVMDATSAFHKESRDAVQMVMDVLEKEPNTDLLEATIEAFSMSNKIRNINDLDAFMRAKLRGGEYRGEVNTAAWVKELQGVMVHSILSGPKTAIRAIMGTSTASFLRPISQGLGYAMKGDGDALRASMAATNAYIESVPEAFKLFKNRLQSYWSGDISTVKTRFSERTKGDENWELMRRWAEGPTATDADKAAFRVANIARAANDNSFLTYSTKIMAATDDTFRYIMARSRAREKAMKEAMENQKVGAVTEITPELLKEYENNFLSKLIDADGNVDLKSDIFLEAAAKEATLTTDLTGFSAGLEELFNRTPWAKPFFLFARTGINGLALTAKNTPLLNYALKSQRDIFAAKEWTSDLLKYGIANADDLANAKALAMGRQAIGAGVIFIAGQHFMNGNLTGNGPADVSKRQSWIDAGWKPRSFRIGDVWVSYESMEPFNQVLASVADIGDNMKLMGPEWAEMNFARAAFIVGQNAGTKTYMSSVSQLIDLLSGKPHQMQKILGGIANNTLPLAGLRNEVGKLLNPGMRELNSHIGDTIRNRNLLFEYGPGRDLPKKYDMLNGQPIKDWWFPHQLWEGVMPISISLSQGPGRTLLFNSNYDLRMSTMSAPDGTSLAEHPEVRSKFQQAIGLQNLEKELDKLSKRKDIQNSVATMEADLRAGKRHIDPMKAYTHNLVIRQLFTRARNRAWASLRNDPDVKLLIQERRDKQAEVYRTKKRTSRLSSDYTDILQLQPK